MTLSMNSTINRYARVIFNKSYSMILYCLLYAQEMNVDITDPETIAKFIKTDATRVPIGFDVLKTHALAKQENSHYKLTDAGQIAARCLSRLVDTAQYEAYKKRYEGLYQDLSPTDEMLVRIDLQNIKDNVNFYISQTKENVPRRTFRTNRRNEHNRRMYRERMKRRRARGFDPWNPPGEKVW